MTKELSAHYRAYTNIALIKYWGKRDSELFLPVTNSLSLTLDRFYTDTHVTFLADGNQDIFYLNGELQSEKATQKVSQFVQLFRDVAQVDYFVRIDSINHVPTAAGLASSASAFAALACSCNAALQLNLDAKTLSTFARRGSGSASRSLFGGFVEWHKGIDSQSSYAESIDSATWDIAMIVIVLNAQAKKMSSRIGMQHTMETSPFYQMWAKEAEQDLSIAKQAIKAQDFTTLGEVSEHNAMKMHATMLAAKPSFTYFEPDSLIAMEMVKTLREQGFDCYITMDAGPNVKVLCRKSQAESIKEQLAQRFSTEQLFIAYPGLAPHAIERGVPCK